MSGGTNVMVKLPSCIPKKRRRRFARRAIISGWMQESDLAFLLSCIQ